MKIKMSKERLKFVLFVSPFARWFFFYEDFIVRYASVSFPEYFGQKQWIFAMNWYLILR